MVFQLIQALKKTSCLLVALLFLLDIFGLPVFALEQFPANESNSETLSLQPVSGACRTESLSEKDVQRLWDEVLLKGFRGKEFSSGTEANYYRDKLPNDKLLISDEQNQLILEQGMPSQSIKPSEISFLTSKDWPGAFAFGVELTETMRFGKCPEDKKYCALDGLGLQYRNSDQGLLKNLSKITSGNVEDKLKNMSSTDKQEVKEALLETDTNSAEIYSVQKNKGKPLSNSALVDSFNARLTTNCADDSCTILTYSLFDKMFNFGLSVSMVATSFGPALIDTTKRAFNFKGLNLKSTFKNYYAKTKPSTEFYDKSLIEGINRDLSGVGGQAKFQEVLNEVVAGKMKATVKLETLLKETTLDQQRVILKSLQKLKGNLSYANTSFRYLDDKGKVALWQNTNDLLKGLKGEKLPLPDELKGKYIFAKNPSDPTKYIEREINDLGNNRFLGKNEWDELLFNKRLTVKESGQTVPVGDMIEIGSKRKGGALYGITKDKFDGYKTQEYLVDFKGTLKKGSDLTQAEIDEVFKAGNITVYNAESKIEELRPLLVDAEQKSLKNLFLDEMGKKMGDQYKNTDEAVAMLLSKGVKTRPFFSAVDYFAARSNDLFDYYSTKQGFFRWTVAPFAFWHLKRGLGQEKASTYLLPASWKWTELIADQSTGTIYDDAYIDFFSHEGSDEGDIFKQFLNSWAFIYTNVARTVGESLDVEGPMNFLAGTFMKNEPDNLALYVSGTKECSSCSLTSKQVDDKLSLSFLTEQKYNAYLLENTKGEDGQTLIGFAHHSDIKGNRTGESSLTNINLAEAVRKQETCTEKLSELGGLFGTFGKAGAAIFGSEAAGAAIGAEVLTTIAYVLPNIIPIPGFGTWAGFGIGTAMTVLEQQYFADKLGGCVDNEEGYYMHLFVPFKKETTEVTKPTDQLTGAINQGKNAITGLLGGDSNNSAFAQQMEVVGKQVNKLLGNAGAKDIVQAVVSFNNAKGTVDAVTLFYLWVQGGIAGQPSTYEQASKAVEIIKDPDTNTEIEFNGPEGVFKVNGKEVIGKDKEDFIRLTTTDLGIPAKIIPMKLSYLPLPLTQDKMFEINEKGTLTVIDPGVLDCVKQSVKNQTALDLKSSNLSSVLGSVTKVITTDYKQIIPTGTGIIANDTDRKIINGKATIEILGDRSTLIKPHDSPESGKMISIQFTNGFIIYKPESNELILWIRNTNELSSSDVGSAHMNLTTAKNPLTNCDEPAIQLKVNGKSDSEISVKKAEDFTKSLESVGPFQILDTTTHTFMFYSNLENGECKNRMKIINKQTGEITDVGIASLEETPSGFRIVDDSGKEHDFEFSSEDGRPLLKYNDLIETLLRAQGRNGAFWFDPEKGMWYTTNGQLIPLIEAFKQAGLGTKVNPDGSVSGVASTNPLFVQPVSAGGPNFLAQLPSLPEEKTLLLLFIASIIGLIVLIRIKRN